MSMEMLKLSIEEDVKRLRVNDQDEKEFQMVNIEFHEPLSAESETTIHMPYVLYGHYEFLPDKIDLFVFPLLSYNFFQEDQKVVYLAEIVPTVAYEIRDLEISILYGDSSKKIKENKRDIQPFSYELKRLHFILNK